MALNRDLVGKRYSFPPSQAYEVSRELILRHAQALGDDNALYRDRAAARRAGYRDVVAPPTFLAIVPHARVSPIEDPQLRVDKTRGLHAEHRFVHTRPLVAGDEIVLTTTIAGIADAGRHETLHMVSEARTVGGELVSTVDHVVLFRGPDRPGGRTREPEPVAPPVDDPAYPPRRFEVTMLELLAYSGWAWEFEPIHWSPAAAAAAGLPGVIAHGMFTLSKVAQAVTGWTGDPGRIRVLQARFTAPLVVDERRSTGLDVAVTGVESTGDGTVLAVAATAGGTSLLSRATATVVP